MSGRGRPPLVVPAGFRPPGTPTPIAAKISDDLRNVLSEPATKQRFEDIAAYVNPMSGAELLAYIRTEQALWKPVIEQISCL